MRLMTDVQNYISLILKANNLTLISWAIRRSSSHPVFCTTGRFETI